MCRPQIYVWVFGEYAVGKMSRSIIGAVVLPMAFFPTAAWAATGDPSGSPTATVTEDVMPKPGDGEGENPPGDLKFGALKVTPSSGPAGTAVGVASVDKCVDSKGKPGDAVGVLLVDLGQVDEKSEELTGVVTETTAVPGKDGSWSTKITIPKSAKTGATYSVVAGCFNNSGSQPEDHVLLYVNDVDHDFIVVDAPKAPVAQPVTHVPTFTG